MMNLWHKFLGVYDVLPSYHHNKRFTYYLNTKGYFGEEAKSTNIEQDEHQQILEVPNQSALLVGDTINIPMDTSKEEKVIQIGKYLDDDEQEDHVMLLHDFFESFAWTCSDMLGIDPKIVIHNIILENDVECIRKNIHKMNIKIDLLVNAKIENLLDAGFIHPIDYSPWISNIVAMAKPNNHIKVCTDFYDLNKASLKDDFHLPNIDIIVDSTQGHALLSCMDGFSRYNQIFINPQDQYNTTFTTPWGTFCWFIMPFGLKNVGATYQRAMALIFHDFIHNILEDYVDDILEKSITRQ